MALNSKLHICITPYLALVHVYPYHVYILIRWAHISYPSGRIVGVGNVSLVADADHMGREHASREKKLPMVNFLIFVQKNVSTIRFQEIKIRPFQDFEKKAFFSLFLMRKRLSSGQKWFLRPYFPLIRGMFLLKSGLRFSFWALEVPEPRVRKRPLSLTNMAFSSLLVRALPVPETKIEDHFSIETYP